MGYHLECFQPGHSEYLNFVLFNKCFASAQTQMEMKQSNLTPQSCSNYWYLPLINHLLTAC